MAVVEPKPIPVVDPDGIVDDMKAVDRWTMWHGIWSPERGKYDKYPCDVYGKNIQWGDTANWIPFDDAIDAHLADPTTVSGVGMFMGYDESTDLTYWLYDDDHRVNGGDIDPKAQAILDGFPYGYRELSVGMDGFHIIFATKGRTAKYGHNPDDSASELYNGGRFSTVTGIQYQYSGQPFIAPMEAVDRLIELANLQPKKSKAVDSSSNHHDTDDQPKRASDYDVAKAESMLAVISPDVGYHTWVKIGMALRDEGFDVELWDTWSSAGKKYKAGECLAKWDSFGDYDGEKVTYGYVCDLAYKNGWLPANPPVVSPFYMRNGVLYRRAKTKSGSDIRVTSTPPYILARITDIDTNKERLLVGMDMPIGYGCTKSVEFALDRSEVFDKKILYKALADLGGNLSDSNAGLVVEYLTVCDGAKWSANIPRRRSVSRMGWTCEPLSTFMPYDGQIDDPDIDFYPPNDMTMLASAFESPKGTLEEWVEAVGPMRASSIILRAAIAASFASVLLDILGIQSFIVYIWGFSQSGKSVCIKIAGSIWGNPNEGAGYFAKMSDTDTATYMRAGFLHNVPLLLDEFESRPGKNEEAKRASMRGLTYNLTYGMEKNRGTRAATYNQGASWNLLTICAGETPATGDTTQQGALNRMLEINGEPFTDKDMAREAHNVVTRQYGTAGRKYIEYLKGWNVDELVDRFESIRPIVVDNLADNPQADNIALLAFADALAECCIFDPSKSYEEAVEGSLKFANKLAKYTKTAKERDTDRSAISFANEWLAKNKAHFVPSKYSNMVEEPYGKERGEDGERTIFIMCDVFSKALEDNGFNAKKTIRRMANEGILERPLSGAGWQCKQSINGDKVWCYAVSVNALEHFIFDDEVDEA